MTMNRVVRHVNLVGATGELRTGVYDERDHIVVPVVALVEGVIQACNAETPELVRANIFSKAPQAWNGEPVVWDHPRIDTDWVSANSPEILKAYCVGWIFNARADETRLHLEAWIDPIRAERIGGPALGVLERLKAGTMVEVSVGAFVVTEKTPGVWTDGVEYGGVWCEVFPDHLAMLPEGAEGACSNEMGCGAPRVSMRVTKTGMEIMKNKKPAVDARTNRSGVSDENLRGWLQDALRKLEGDAEYLWVEAVFDDTVVYSIDRAGGSAELVERDYALDEGQESVTVGEQRRQMRRKVDYEEIPRTASRKEPSVNIFTRILDTLGVRSAQDDGLSDADLRAGLWEALRAVEPGFESIIEVFPDSRTVIYAAMPEDRMLWLRRTYDAPDDDAVSVNDDREEVIVKTVYEPVAAEAAQQCTCGASAAQKPADVSKEEEQTMNCEERVKALVANEATPYTDDHVEWLSTAPVDAFEALEAQYAGSDDSKEDDSKEDDSTEPKVSSADDDDASESDADDDDAVTVSRADHEEMKAALAERRESRKTRKAKLVKLVADAQDSLDEKQLRAKDLEALEELARMFKVETTAHDYSGVVLGAGDEDADASDFDPPDTYGLTAAAAKRDNKTGEVS